MIYRPTKPPYIPTCGYCGAKGITQWHFGCCPALNKEAGCRPTPTMDPLKLRNEILEMLK